MKSFQLSFLAPMTAGLALFVGAAACGDSASPPGQQTGPVGAGTSAEPVQGGAGTLGAAGTASSAGTMSVAPNATGGQSGAAGTTAAQPDAGPATPDAAQTPDAATADAGDAPDDVVLPKPPCLEKGSQVVLLGDSYINWVSHTFPADLDREAGQSFRMYAVGGFAMGSGGIGLIPPQLDQAVADDPDITTIVMTGGGNDVLVPDILQFPQGGDCKMLETSPTIPDCQKIVAKALEAADKMMLDGIAKLDNEVTHVVYFFYPNVPEGTVVGGTHPNAILEYSAPMVKDFCDTTYERSDGKIACHFVDLRDTFMGHDDYFAPTDIHPNLMGSAAMAKAVWQTMKDNCLAQPASSGCCEP